jgi:hypothetical protein
VLLDDEFALVNASTPFESTLADVYDVLNNLTGNGSVIGVIQSSHDASILAVPGVSVPAEGNGV